MGEKLEKRNLNMKVGTYGKNNVKKKETHIMLETAGSRSIL